MLAQKAALYTNNASGNLNKQQQKNKYKQIDLDDLDVEMISPQFLQAKTLKKPFKEFDISAIKTNPNGLKEASYYRNQPATKQYPEAVIFKKDEVRDEKKKNNKVTVIDASELNIKPAFKRSDDDSTPIISQKNGDAPVIEKDKNTILSAMLRKGLKPEVVIKPDIMITKQEKIAGPAESKLKAMMGKTSSKETKTQQRVIERQTSKRAQQKKEVKSQIGQQINEQFDDYGNQSFQKLSGAYESVIKQSIIGDSNIRESIAGDSNIIKQSIRESIRQSFASSSGKIKQSIREDIKESIQESSRSLKEEIIEQISASFKKSKESIEEVYEEIFEEESLSNSFSKSQNKFRKNVKNNETDSLSQSQSASKSFRMKTNIAKSLKFAQQMTKKQKLNIKTDTIEDKVISQSIMKEKQNIKRIQQNISKLLTKKPNVTISSQKNKDLYYNFKVQINKLLTGDHFESKLKRIVSFLSISDEIMPNKQYINDLQDSILKNILGQIENIKVGKQHLTEVQKIKQQYENKLTEQLRIQEVNLRAEMNQKLSEKDFELKKMIAELQNKMMSRTVHVESYGRSDYAAIGKSQQFEVESDYSIDSDNISWKADLWQLLPDYQKKKLYEKQTAEVTKFLTDVMMNELKEEALERSLDISFEFPEEYNNLSGSYEQNQQQKKAVKQKQKAFVKKQPQVKHDRSDYLSDLPKIPMKKVANQNQIKSFNAPRQEIETKFESTRKDENLKPQIIKILSQYKAIYLKKKQETIKNLLKLLTSKDNKVQNALYSSIQQLTILSQKQFKKQHMMYVRAYEEEIIMGLVGIYTRTLNKRQDKIEDEMKNMYERLIVVSQVATAEKCVEKVSLDVEKDSVFNVEVLTKDALRKMEIVPCPIEILAHENYMELKAQKQQKQVKNELVEHIINILSSEFAKEFPKKKK